MEGQEHAHTFGSAISVDSPFCSGDGTSTVLCDRGDGSSTVLEMGGGDDVVRRGSPTTDVIRGGDGDDSLLGGAGDDIIDGGPGDDVIEDPEWVNCTDFAGPLAGQAGADQLIGGTGSDSYDGICRDDLMSMSMNGAADDGAAGEGDNLAGDIEIFKGSRGGMKFVGNDLPQTVNGADSPLNELLGGGGDDKLYGGINNDTVDGGAGNDVVYGYGGNDTIIGGSGQDDLQGEGGSSISDGAGGSDVIRAQDGERDTVACGSFADQAFVDHLDVIAGGSARDVCEEVFRSGVTAPPPSPLAPPPPPPPVAGPPVPTLAIGLASKTATVTAGKARVKIRCSRASTCKGKVTLLRKTRVLGSATFSIASGKVKTIAVRLNKAGRRVARTRSAKVTASIKLNGAAKAVRSNLTLKR